MSKFGGLFMKWREGCFLAVFPNLFNDSAVLLQPWKISRNLGLNLA